jgi:Cu(I)/Ag(I) efflux system membrane fusion protein
MKKLALSLGLLAALTLAAYGGYRYAQHRLMNAAPAQAHAGAPAHDDGGKQVLYWYDPMHPQQRFDKPGKSPFMDMQLVPKYAGEDSEPGTVSISPNVVQNLGVRIAEAKHGAIEQRLEAVGTVAFNERGVVQLQARAAGFVERLHARAPLDPVAKDAPLVDILFPEWAGAQEEYLLLRKSGSAQLAAAARQRLALLGMSEAQIEAVDGDGKVRNRFTLTAPISGVIAELGVREGASVVAGQTLFRLVDLSTVWVNAEVPEAQAAWVTPGARAEARVPGYPGQVFQGRVGALLPEVNATTRTVRARVEVANRGALLKPGMFATLQFPRGDRRESVLVPSEALIRTGTRNVVIVSLGEGRFRATDVEVGFESGGETEIRKGVQAGEKVVLSGQFLIDSEASLSAAESRLEGSKEPAAHKGRGIVTALDAQQGRVELDHDPIPSMQWPKMKMGFVVENKAELQALKKGDAVRFELQGKPNEAGDYVIRHIAPERKK